MGKLSTYGIETILDGDYLAGTHDPAGTPGTANFVAEAVAAYVAAKMASLSGLAVANNVTAQTGISGTPTLLAAFDTVLPEINMAGDHSANTLTIGTIEGKFIVNCSFSFSGVNSATYAFELFKNNVATGLKMDRKLGTGGDVGSSGFNGIVAGAEDDVFDVRVSGTGATVTVTNAQFTMLRAGA